MRLRFWLVLAVLLGGLFLLGHSSSALTNFRSGPSAGVPAGETLDSTLFAGAKNLDIAGTVNGDVICGAQNLNISGTVKGDVICGAQTINLSGMVEGSIRLGAQTVNLTGQVGRNATIAAQTINTDSKSMISGDASFAGTDLNLNGNIGRDLAVTGNNLNLIGTVGRDIKSSANFIALSGSAKVAGGIDYTSKHKIDISGGASVGGNVTQNIPKASNAHIRLLFFGNVLALFLALFLLITALIVTALLPQMVHSVSGQAIKRPWRVLLTGLLASIVVPVIAILLMISVVGIPLAVLLLIAWLLIALLSGLFTAYYVGRLLWSSQHNPLLRVLLGSFVLLVLMLVPFLGSFVFLATFWIGAGMILLELKSRTPRPSYKLQ